MSWLDRCARFYFSRRAKQIDRFADHAGEIQYEQLSYLLKHAPDIKLFNETGQTPPRNYDEFVRNTPIRRYEELMPYVERIRNGEPNVLWDSPTHWLVRSSGTTADRSKFIPLTREALSDCHHRGNKDVLALYLQQHPHSRIFRGKTLILGGSSRIDTHDARLSVGDLSAILISTTPPLLNYFKAPRSEVALIPEFDLKVQRICETATRENIVAFAGVPSWNLVLMRRILEYTGKQTLTEVWPRLEAFIHGGIGFSPYRSQFEQIIPRPEMNYMETYNASEGFFALQDSTQRNDLLLMLDYRIFFEFLPVASLDQPQTAVPLEGVQLGVNYAMIISTNGGLWRYLIGDTVQFTSLAPYRIRITGRTKQFINTFGEELIVDNAEQALKVACRATGAVVHEYTAGPVYMENNQKGAHQWIIEFDRLPDRIDTFSSILDQTLQQLNSDYEAKRYKETTLKPPQIVTAPRGTFLQWMADRQKLGGQNKVPRLSNDRIWLDLLLKKIKERENDM